MKKEKKHPTYFTDFGFHPVAIDEETAAINRWSQTLTKDEFFNNYIERFKYTPNDESVNKEKFISAQILIEAYNSSMFERSAYRYTYNLVIRVFLDNETYNKTRVSCFYFTENTKSKKFNKLLKEYSVFTLIK